MISFSRPTPPYIAYSAFVFGLLKILFKFAAVWAVDWDWIAPRGLPKILYKSKAVVCEYLPVDPTVVFPILSPFSTDVFSEVVLLPPTVLLSSSRKQFSLLLMTSRRRVVWPCACFPIMVFSPVPPRVDARPGIVPDDLSKSFR